MSSETAATVTAPWWVSGGSERCPRCLQLYAYELEVRCVSCDGPLCPFCAIEVSAAAMPLCCEGCAAEEEG